MDLSSDYDGCARPSTCEIGVGDVQAVEKTTALLPYVDGCDMAETGISLHQTGDPWG